ncbi:UNVERIFIED_CONTAM: hypothetical protein RMT77_011057 [Armadillidium vulgare]
MTDSKEDNSNGESSKKEKHGNRPKFQSQFSNISFTSYGGGNENGSGRTSPVTFTQLTNSTTFPRVSLRSILMNSPFSKRNKPRRGCIVTKPAKSSNDIETRCHSRAVNVLESQEENLAGKSESSLKCCSGIQNGNMGSLRRSSFGSKSHSSSKGKSFSWGMYSESDANSSPLTTSVNSLNGQTKKCALSFTTSENASSSTSAKLKECSLCLQELEIDKFPQLLTCNHSSCIKCMQQYLMVEITESRVNISCPQCHQLMHPTDIHSILSNPLLSYKYEDFMLRRVLSMDPDTRWCPAPDCGYAVIASGCASCPRLKCERPGCESSFCYHCKAEWHPNQTCDMARAQRSPNAPFSSFSCIHDLQNNDDVKSCPRCQVLIVKMDDGSCNHMTCSVCSAEFCWLCMKEISDLHYLSPSGCTFWGKKPWSRKKKILWQLGTLVGAPLGIGLVAGLAVPAMIIGIPIWVGRKIHSRYANHGKHKRNLAMVGGVTASALISPVLAGLAVSIGVPILLAYVYGVVPISLCRSGGCGVTTSASGVRIAFDDENDMVIGIPGRQIGEPTQSSAANPSIGEVSCGASFSTESGAHLLSDSDRESASTAAIAPASLTGSIASSCLSRSHRLEVQADIVHGTRSLASVDTNSLATSERSTHTLDMENASTKALAGSLLQQKVVEDECESVNESTGRYHHNGDSASGVMDASGNANSILHNHVTNLYIHPGADATSVDASSLHSGMDMRLDSVSAIIKAKGVTFTDTDDEIVEDMKTFCSFSSTNNSVVLEMEGEKSDVGNENSRHLSSSLVKFSMGDFSAGSHQNLPGTKSKSREDNIHNSSYMSQPSVRPKSKDGEESVLRRSMSVLNEFIGVTKIALPIALQPLRSKSHPKLNDI